MQVKVEVDLEKTKGGVQNEKASDNHFIGNCRSNSWG